MQKTIYWINNDIKEMANLAQRIFPHFWNLNGEGNTQKSNIIVFGSPSADKVLYSAEEGYDLQHKIEDLLHRKCRSLEGQTWRTTLYQKYRYLVENCVNLVLPYSWENEHILWELRMLWNLTDENNEPPEEAKVLIKNIISKMNIEYGSDVAIRLILLNEDINQINKGNCIISMELYYQLKHSCNCFLYTDRNYDGATIDSWKEIYRKIYKEEPPAILKGVLSPNIFL